MRHLCIFLTHPFFSGFAINLQKADVSFIQEYSVTLLVK